MTNVHLILPAGFLPLPGQDFFVWILCPHTECKRPILKGQDRVHHKVNFFSEKGGGEYLPEFNIDVNTTTPQKILKKLNIIKTNTAGILFGSFSYRIVNFNIDGDILDQSEKQGLYNILSDDFVEQIQSRSRKKGTHVEGSSTTVQEEMPYPVKALREILANAVAHSLYQKNNGDIVVEIHPNKITVRNNCSPEAKLFVNKWLSRIYKPMNKHLMNTLRAARITDEQGTGKMRILRLMLESGKREPIIEFNEYNHYCTWSITLCNDETNKALKSLAEELKDKFTENDQWRMAIALLLWRKRSWKEVKQYLDEYNKDVAEQVLKNEHCPVFRYQDGFYTKRWAMVRLTGRVTRQFNESEKTIIFKLLRSNTINGHISSEQARKIIGLSDHQSEKSQLSALFKEWKQKSRIEKVKKGHWKFL